MKRRMSTPRRVLVALFGVVAMVIGVGVYFTPLFEPTWRALGLNAFLVLVGALLVVASLPSRHP